MDQALDLTALKRYLERREEVVAAYLFGSHARGEADARSDVDIAFLLRPNLPDLAHLTLTLDWEVCDALGTDEVDVVILNTAPLEARFEILRTGRLIHSNDEALRTEWEVQTMSAWWDFRKVLDLYDCYAFRRMYEEMTDAERREYQAARAKIRRMHSTPGVPPGHVSRRVPE
ncbi:MAG TPA: nucleotidyltransferase domain-containing protein [Chloroflexi bacterium]|nr:nucleotidyltransferase domain-containing protein [Chloroflexota bacterium]